MLSRSEALALIAVAALCVVGIIACALAHVAIPTVLGDLAFTAIGAGAGAALPRFRPPPPTAGG